jgi:hypothetical protein
MKQRKGHMECKIVEKEGEKKTKVIQQYKFPHTLYQSANYSAENQHAPKIELK